MLDFPIFESSWGADEELLLVEGLELHGVGNWEQISDHIGTKNKIECADHYDRVYVQSDVFPSPNPNLKSDFSTLQRARPAGYTKAQLPPPSRPLSSAPANHEIAGFMPGRREFEHEFDNDAEQQVKDLEFTEDDTPEEIALKCAMLNIYNTALSRRAERKKFVFDRNLIDFKKIQSQEKRRPKEEKELYHKMRVFAKLMTESDFQVFMDGLLAELRLRMRIAHLQEYRRMGITTHRDAAEFEKERAIRTTNKAAGLTGFTIERSASRRHKLDEIFSLSLTSTSPNAHTNSGTHSSQPFFRNLNSAAGNSGSSSTIPTTPSYSTRTPSTSLTPAPLGGRKPANPLDVTNTDGVELLTEKECQLCSSLRLFPRAYLAIKDIIIKENLAHGFIKRRHVRSLVKIDVNKTSKIFDFFLEMGWITNVS
ncbi:Transcriptional adapter ada2, variant 2 [Batrachochytrium dendrobatidis]|nr:Transcriptional adapter ada2, variant 2 [Batrachochytrium dendrobatidis]